MSTTLFDLTGRIALVTGATSGLGHAMARGLGAAGATIVANGRRPERVEVAVEGFRGEGLTAHGAAFDVTDETVTAREIARIEREIGPIDILINNAGIQRRNLLIDFDLATFEEVMRTNLTGVFLVARAVAKGMAERRRGKIVNIASLASEVARRTTGPYTAAKGAVKQLTKAMCVEWAPHGIQVNAIGPGYFATPLNQVLRDDAAFNTWVEGRTPAGRWGDPKELVGAAVFLSSPASDFVNGHVLYVDGGLLASM